MDFRSGRRLEMRGVQGYLLSAMVACAATTSGCRCGPTDAWVGKDDGSGDAATRDGGGQDGGAKPCGHSSDCAGGACLGGSCCDVAARVCGSACCAENSVCLSGQCVVLGAPCRTSRDCGGGSYCETAWGAAVDAGSGVTDDGGVACTQAPPLEGRCLPFPPRCADGGAPADAGCVATCEYRPDAGPLDAVVRWSWGSAARTRPADVDVWATPSVGRLRDGNCDGVIDELDAPSVVFVSANSVMPQGTSDAGQGVCCQCTGLVPTTCHRGVLRALDGRTGREAWTLERATPSSIGFAGTSTALGDLDGDGRMEIAAVTGEGYVVIADGDGRLQRISDQPIPGFDLALFGWGGGLAIADMDHDGAPEIAHGATVFTTAHGTLHLLFSGTGHLGGAAVSGPGDPAATALSTFVDLDGQPGGKLELLAGSTAYRVDGSPLWHRADLPDGFPGVADFDGDGRPEVVLVAQGQLWVLDGASGVTRVGPLTLPGTGAGGAPTIADFDGDGRREVGVAMATFYSVIEVGLPDGGLNVKWSTPNHDYSSSVTGSSVFDFEGDGRAEVIYADECFLWVFDGATGGVRFAAPHTSFTGTEASLLADVDGDGRAELLMISNGSDPRRWGCVDGVGAPVTVNGVQWTPGPAHAGAYRGITMFGDRAHGWVGTRTLWNEHTYHVTNICDDRDSACGAGAHYGAIPRNEVENWSLPWANGFRQNVQDRGVFDAPDATLVLAVDCTSPALLRAAVRNLGLASLPAGVSVEFFLVPDGGAEVKVGAAVTTHALLPGQTEEVRVSVDATVADARAHFIARIAVESGAPAFRECRADNDSSAVVTGICVN